MTTQVDAFKEHLKSDNQTVKPVGVFKRTEYKYVEVEAGLTDEGNYAWHFASFRREKPFPKDPVLFIRIIKTYLEPALPADSDVKVMLSPGNWDKSVISVIVKGIGKQWNFNEEMINKPIPKICELMNEEIDRITPKRKFL